MAAFWVVWAQIAWPETWALLRQMPPLYLLTAFLLYHLSKWIGALRYRQLLALVGRPLPVKTHLRLNYAGMFYSLFLPGSISGDGYKVLVLRNPDGNPGWKAITRLTALDRLSGVLGLLAWLVAMVPVSGFWAWMGAWQYAYIPLVVGGGLVAVLLVRFILRTPYGFIFRAAGWSLGVQGAQLLAALLLLMGLGIETAWLDYLVLFLLSSLATLFPFTVGGAGARELVFLVGARYAGLAAGPAVALGLLFFVINLLAALPGAWLMPSKAELRAKAEV